MALWHWRRLLKQFCCGLLSVCCYSLKCTWNTCLSHRVLNTTQHNTPSFIWVDFVQDLKNNLSQSHKHTWREDSYCHKIPEKQIIVIACSLVQCRQSPFCGIWGSMSTIQAGQLDHLSVKSPRMHQLSPFIPRGKSQQALNHNFIQERTGDCVIHIATGTGRKSTVYYNVNGGLPHRLFHQLPVVFGDAPIVNTHKHLSHSEQPRVRRRPCCQIRTPCWKNQKNNYGSPDHSAIFLKPTTTTVLCEIHSETSKVVWQN